MFFVSTKGDICASNFQCDYSFLGGIRPIVTIEMGDVAGMSSTVEEKNDQKNPITYDIIVLVTILCIISGTYFLVFKNRNVKRLFINK